MVRPIFTPKQQAEFAKEFDQDRVWVTEEIEFRPDGSSRHIWKAEDGTVLEDKTYQPSPVLFIDTSGPKFALVTARAEGVVSVTRRVRR